ncbi:MAG: DinB family protein [Ignavibacteriales bacterium]|nr:DinB family protein [Ignavibacteriales bacterium]
MKRPNELSLLTQIVEEGYSRKTWHGPNLRGAVRGLTVQEASWRLSAKRHNIWEIVVHCAYWKYIVRRRILAEKKGSFPLKGSNWFHRPEHRTESAWKQDVKLLGQMHVLLTQAIAHLQSSDLQKKPQGSEWTIRSTLYGIAMHDVYHAGQVQLLKRLMR